MGLLTRLRDRLTDFFDGDDGPADGGVLDVARYIDSEDVPPEEAHQV